MRRGISSFKQGSGGKEDKEWLDSGKVQQPLDSPDTHISDKGGFPLSFSTDLLALPRGASITEPHVTTNHSCRLPRAPKKNGLSFLWLNSIPST